ncbi:hypothetical protein [Burkholderia lata]|uniref:hypothetical protein n=1 Tax=Burkholderia lata (strain ATCC 17760 / DSM 23089 / LMG 22485 / NCIMB 9086 / R18194 / 383) TaxID=482957 RepID=UPI0012FD4AF9|nr:hypothetical protein [Burkholderia lata]
MGQPGLITMSMRELDRRKIVVAVIEPLLMRWRAAERLGISRRQDALPADRARKHRPVAGGPKIAIWPFSAGWRRCVSGSGNFLAFASGRNCPVY